MKQQEEVNSQSEETAKGQPFNYRPQPTTDLRLSKLSLPKGPIGWSQQEKWALPEIKVRPRGLSISGFQINIDSAKMNLCRPLCLLLVLNSLLRCVTGSGNCYYFKDLSSTIYGLCLSGIEDLASAITALREGACEVTESETVPKDIVSVRNYYDHGNQVPIYAASLIREKHGITNETLVNCVSELVKQAHDAWEDKVLSPLGISIIVGAFMLVSCITFLSLQFCPGSSKRQDYQDTDDAYFKFLGRG